MARHMAVISGAGCSAYAMKSGRTAAALIGDAIAAALDEAGLHKSEVDGLIVQGGLDYDMVGINFGLETRYSMQTWAHGRLTGPTILTAAAVIAAGMARHVLCVHGRSGVSRFGGTPSVEASREGGGAHGEVPYYGLTAPGSAAALSWRRYVDLYGADIDALRHVVAAQRHNATLNPNAVLRDKPLSEDDYLSERFIIEPLRRADFALPNDGAAAVIVSAPEAAPSGLPILGGQGMIGGRSEAVFARPGMELAYQDDPVGSWTYADPEAYRAAGITARDIHVVGIYDSFSPSVILDLERFGHCREGEGWRFVAEGRMAIGGDLPVNTSGGHVAESGLSGWNHVVELYRQLRGQAGARQVAGAQVGQFISPNGCTVILGAA